MRHAADTMTRFAGVALVAFLTCAMNQLALAQMKIPNSAVVPNAQVNAPPVTPGSKVLSVPGPFLDPERVKPALRNQIREFSTAAKIHTFIFHPDGFSPGKIDWKPAMVEANPALGSLFDEKTPRIRDGRPAPEQLRIANGQPITTATAAPDDPFKRVVAITYTEWGARDASLCTGIILDAKHVLTAGHCGCAPFNTYGISIDDKVTNQKFPFVLEGPPTLFDQRVCRDHVLFGNDLALLTIKTTFTCPAALTNATTPNSTATAPAPADCRTRQSQVRNGPSRTFGYPRERFLELAPPLTRKDSLLAVGYGFTETHAIGARMQGSIPVKSVACTESRYANVCAPYAELILAFPQRSNRHTDTCGGDSGGPIFSVKDGRYFLVGITSRAAPFSHVDNALHCGGGGIYTLIGRSTVHDWFRTNGVQEEATLGGVASN